MANYFRESQKISIFIIKYLTIFLKIGYREFPVEKAKPAARRGRKATGLNEIAGLPGVRQRGFFYSFT
jgi:hypothetical protein